MTRDQVDATLHEDPALADAAPFQFLGEGEAARRVMPEQIVGDEDVVADGREVIRDRGDRALAYGAGMQLPDGTERTAERTAARGFDQPDRAVRETRILPAPAIDKPPAVARARHRARAFRVRRRFVKYSPPVRLDHEPRHFAERRALLESGGHTRHGTFAVVDHDCGDVGRQGTESGRRRQYARR